MPVGSALAFKMDGVPRVATSFFGEGTFDEGILYECLNYAAIQRLPVLFVCENNFYATESPLEVRQPAGTQLCDRVRAFKIEAQRVDGNDVAAVYDATRRAVERIRSGDGPFLPRMRNLPLARACRPDVRPRIEAHLSQQRRSRSLDAALPGQRRRPAPRWRAASPPGAARSVVR